MEFAQRKLEHACEMEQNSAKDTGKRDECIAKYTRKKHLCCMNS